MPVVSLVLKSNLVTVMPFSSFRNDVRQFAKCCVRTDCEGNKEFKKKQNGGKMYFRQK
jgi:hypothetical protein